MFRGLATATAVVAVALGASGTAAAAALPDPIDCVGAPAQAVPGTLTWHLRELREVYCGEQRVVDTATNPGFQLAGAFNTLRDRAITTGDPYRDPTRFDGSRFRYFKTSFVDPKGRRLAARLFLPCDASCRAMPAGLTRFSAPYPAVIVVHGGSAHQEMYWWGSEALAEAGYLVLTFQVPLDENTGSDSFPGDTAAAVDFLVSTPAAPTSHNEVNPRWRDLDPAHIGLAGHSAGGFAVSQVGQEDSRVSAIVSWDRAQSSPMREDLPLRTPALFMTADYNCQKVPVCVPQPYTSAPDPLGPGNKDEDFQRLRAAGVDTMKISLRSATHLDFTQFGLAGTGSRYGAAVAAYYTLAWFDRYLRGAASPSVAADATRRLTATSFDASADVHSISGGRWDPTRLANVPPMLAGLPVANRLSFHFRSGWFLDGGALACDDIRAGC
jgi:dienelactone hydrolase